MSQHSRPLNLSLPLLLFLLILHSFPSRIHSLESPTRSVFAHYMVALGTYNKTLPGFTQDILDAQAVGIDGFALNIGEWSTNANYKKNSLLMYQAAKNLGTNFTLFASIDMTSPISDLIDMISTFHNQSNQLTKNGKTVVSTFATQNLGMQWLTDIINPLKQKGIEIFFVPYFYPSPISETPTQSVLQQNFDSWWSQVVDGMFYFGAAALPTKFATVNEAYSNVLRGNSTKTKLFMAGVSPQYWGMKQTTAGRRYFEYQGGIGLEQQWMSIINNSKPEWVEIVTWNDYTEASYISPCYDFAEMNPWIAYPKEFFHSRAGLLKLMSFYIQWFKTGVKPQIVTDSLVYMYRIHSKNLTTIDGNGNVTSFGGDVKDVIYLTTILTAPAMLRVRSGSLDVFEVSVSSGIVQSLIPFSSGNQTFEIIRNGTQVLNLIGKPIRSTISNYNYVYNTGFGEVTPPFIQNNSTTNSTIVSSSSTPMTLNSTMRVNGSEQFGANILVLFYLILSFFWYEINSYF